MNSNPVIEEVLNKNKVLLKGDFEKYRNHVYRIFYLCLKQDSNDENITKYAIASAFHDIGIWTHHTFDYLKPSIQEAAQYLDNTERATWKEEVSLMIDMHHKRSRYHGIHEQTVETFRRADWMDVSKGFIHFNLSKKDITELQVEFPAAGFHLFLVKQTIKNFFKHPFNPLPMFKK